MASLSLHAVSKLYGAHRAVDAVSFGVDAGEFLALLGPSGCGKTTLLRLIAGFEAPSAGRIELDGQVVAEGPRIVPPENRGIGMVFQSYALWPTMTVADNVAFALRLRKMPGAQRERRVAETLEAVGLAALAQRKPHELSGGQRQRVALARCLAMRPAVMLLDEPLANLDVHLRATLQQEFKQLHRETGATFLYVTHDQGEAMAMADRIAVMRDGRIEQLAAPRELYREPQTATIADFIGAGMVVPVDIVGVQAGGVAAAGMGGRFTLRGTARAGQRRLACLRATDLALAAPGGGALPGVVRAHSYRGAVTTVTVAPLGLADLDIHVDHAGEPPAIGANVHVAVLDGWILPDAS
ncbi:MAG: ABC transporter ATP-binding protein [Bordetella sp.]|uniref:ABC transporter ATP-binding protein n=1 Tax=Bordetella sp. TaxID=28081 RepID=UPI003F7C3E0F